MSERDIDTETLTKPAKSSPGLLVKIGNHKLTVPTATIISGALVALGTAYQVVKNDRAEIIARLDAQEHRTTELAQKMELEQVVLSEIRTQLARIDARVAEVQVTLMRGGRP